MTQASKSVFVYHLLRVLGIFVGVLTLGFKVPVWHLNYANVTMRHVLFKLDNVKAKSL